jgi:hypothetical protein
MTEKSILDARLAEIDRRLRTIQSGLAPALEDEPRDPAPVVPPDAAPVPKRLPDTPGAHEAAALVTELRALVEAHERLLASARALLDARNPPDRLQAPVGLSAGPFASTEALRSFERSLQALPEVRAVRLREYEGTDRAVIDVHLAQPNP